MTDVQAPASGPLSIWWKIAAIVTMVFGFTILIGLTVEAYRQAPPIPARAVEPGGAIIFTSDDVVAGQQVFLKHGLMANGTIWGHGAYLGPDFSAQYLHNWALDVADHAAQERFHRPYVELTPDQQAEFDGSVARTMKQNHYNSSSGDLSLTSVDARSFERQIAYWTDYFVTPANNGGLAAKSVADPQELRELTAFFAWTAWASTAARPGASHSYTNNFPYDPLAGNVLDRRARGLQRAQPGVSACRHGHRAARLRQVRSARLASSAVATGTGGSSAGVGGSRPSDAGTAGRT